MLTRAHQASNRASSQEWDLDLAVIVPTYCEASNITALVDALTATLHGIAFEIIFVDDHSPDGTSEEARKLARKHQNIRCLERIGRRGLSTACIEGIMSTAAPFAAVIDGDLQHDEALLPRMLNKLKEESYDIVVGSRYADGGEIGDWTPGRAQASKFATHIAKFVTKTSLSDPLSGFFMIRTDTFRSIAPDLSGVGFKILLDIFASSPTALNFAEIPYRFRERSRGESKLDAKVMLEYLELLIDKTTGKYGIPAKFVMFGLVGAFGVVVHMATLSLFYGPAGLSFQTAQVIATLIAMTSNFGLNNVFTYYDNRLRGLDWIKGWISFCIASSVGAIANVGISVYLYKQFDTFWVLSAIAGILVGVVWNYSITSIFTWQRTKRS